MKKIIWFIFGILLIGNALASMTIPSNENAKEHSKAPENSPAIGLDWTIDRIEFIHYAKPTEKPAKPSSNSCYKLMGVKWINLPVSYTINPTNNYGMSVSFITESIGTSAETWDIQTKKELFSDAYLVDYNIGYGIRDYTNSIVFEQHPDSNVIAVTSVWYSPVFKQILEFDILFNTDYSWGDATQNPSLMDLQNIATHELGHAVGLADLYTISCNTATMYGYSAYGEIGKRSLENPDITGLQKIYGR